MISPCKKRLTFSFRFGSLMSDFKTAMQCIVDEIDSAKENLELNAGNHPHFAESAHGYADQLQSILDQIEDETGVKPVEWENDNDHD